MDDDETTATLTDDPVQEPTDGSVGDDGGADQVPDQNDGAVDGPAADSDQQTEQTDAPNDTVDEQLIEMPNDSSGDAGQADGDTTLSPAPTRPYGVESWRPLVTEMAGDIPVEVLLRWIKHESGGNPCSTGKIVNGASIENGLFQLYSPDDDHIATPAQLHGSFCSGQTCVRDLTLDEARIQVASGIAYVRSCRERARAQLGQAGVVWDEAGSDFWSLVKMQHNLPSVPKQYIAKLRPSSWSEFKDGVLADHPAYASSSIFTNAEDIGSAAGL